MQVIGLVGRPQLVRQVVVFLSYASQGPKHPLTHSTQTQQCHCHHLVEQALWMVLLAASSLVST